MAVRVKVFHGIWTNLIEGVVGEWLAENPVKVVAVTQSQFDSGINLTIFYEDTNKQDQPG